MKKVLKILGILAGVLVVVIIGGVIYFNSSFPDVDPAPNIKVQANADRIARGQYIANHVAVCIDCHSERDWTKFSGPVVPGSEGKGGESFGTIYARNITPANLGSWSDGELIRAITCGVNKNGDALFPIMPYTNYNKMTEEDLQAVVAYIRTLKPIENNVPPTELSFPLNFIVKTIPIKHYVAASPVDKTNELEYGKYLVTIASCGECHTPAEQGKPLPGMTFAGGQEFDTPMGLIKSANITPDKETGIGNWTKADFVKRFKSYDPAAVNYISVSKGDFNTVMPWTMYAGMTEEDLSAIYTYLASQKAVKNLVKHFSPAKTVASK